MVELPVRRGDDLEAALELAVVVLEDAEPVLQGRSEAVGDVAEPTGAQLHGQQQLVGRVSHPPYDGAVGECGAGEDVGTDAVLAPAGRVSALVGTAPPDV